MAHSVSHSFQQNRTMRFVHSGDWHIGVAAGHAGAAADRVRKARVEAARAVVAAARVEAADFIVLAGDTFDSNGVSRSLVAEAASVLGAAHCPVFVLPGNHDPLTPGSVWEHDSWSRFANIRILREAKPVAIEGGTLYPCPIYTRTSSEDPTAWIASDAAAGLRIGIAHGTVGDLNADHGFPIPFDAASRCGLDYLALGDWHSAIVYDDGRIAYCGTHETTKFGERDSGNVLLVDVAKRGATPLIRRLRTGALEWVQVHENITEPGRLREIARRLEADARQDRLVDVRLSGLLFEREAAELDRIRGTLGYYLAARLDESALRPAPSDDDWIRQLPAGLAQHTAERLRAMASAEGEAGAVAAQALRELYVLHSEVRA